METMGGTAAAERLERLAIPFITHDVANTPAGRREPRRFAGAGRKLLDVGGLSEYIGVPVGTLYQWVSRKQIPYVKVNRLTRFDIRVIDAWLAGNSHKPLEFFEVPGLPGNRVRLARGA